MMKPLADNIINKRITIIDLPGFGESKEPDDIWDLSDYVENLHKLLKELDINNPSLIGHSFGGRIAIKYASKYKVNKLILFGSPCIRENRQDIKEKIFKKIKKLPLMNKFGEYMKKYSKDNAFEGVKKLQESARRLADEFEKA